MDAWLKRAAPAKTAAAPAAADAGKKATTGATAPNDVQQASNPYDGSFPKIKVKSTAAPPGKPRLSRSIPLTNVLLQIPHDSHGLKSTDRRASRT